MSVKLISITPDAENLITYCARVSSPNQTSDNPERLLKYCVLNAHWSIFEMAHMVVEITTTRAISPQILRHKSFSFQEFSQRYAEVTEIEIVAARRQDTKNRQSSHDDLSEDVKKDWVSWQALIHAHADEAYQWALARGIAKECARSVLPLSTKTKLYMAGSIRSWIHYLEVRTHPSTQLEHREIASAIRELFREQLPIISEALDG
jgi:thymidylate synthase (FAD)